MRPLLERARPPPESAVRSVRASARHRPPPGTRDRDAPCLPVVRAAAAVRARRPFRLLGARGHRRRDRARAQVRGLARRRARHGAAHGGAALAAGRRATSARCWCPFRSPRSASASAASTRARCSRGPSARAWGAPVHADALQRTRATAAQTRLTPGERLRNVAGAFRVGGADHPGAARGARRARRRRRDDREHAQRVRRRADRGRCAHPQLCDLRPGPVLSDRSWESTDRLRGADAFVRSSDPQGDSPRWPFASVSTASAASAVRSSAPPSSRASPTSTSSPSTTSRTRRRSRTCSSTTRSIARTRATSSSGEGSITIDGDEIKIFAEKDPAKLPWEDLGVDIVLESTGRFTDADKAEAHIAPPARRR